MNCDCKVGTKKIPNMTLSHNLVIEYCPTHAAAPEMLAALEYVEWVMDMDTHIPYCPWCLAIKSADHFEECRRQQALAAVAKEGE